MSKKKDAALSGLSKKERKQLEKKAAKIEAELAERKARKDEKAAKKVKPSKPEKTAPPVGVEAVAELEQVAEQVTERDETDAEIKARVLGKKAAREAHIALAAQIDRADEAAVSTYNEEAFRLGVTLLTSDTERAEMAARVAKPQPDAEKVNAAADKVLADKAAPESAKAKAREAKARVAEPVEQVAEVLETEEGSVIAVGSPQPDAPFAQPSEAPLDDFELTGNGRYKITDPNDPRKVVSYTRATTYIKGLEDTTNLVKWAKRMLLTGVIVNEAEAVAEGSTTELATSRIRDLIHNRDVAQAKARKRDAKGKLGIGELAAEIKAADKVFKDAMNAIIEELEEIGGIHDKANKGTDIHALCEIADAQGIDAVGEMLTNGQITPADLADVQGYRRAMDEAGVEVVHQYTEQVVVNDTLKVGGRVDRILMLKLPGAQRRTKVVGDIKTGSIEYSIGSIAQQLDIYAGAEAYNLETGERSKIGASRTKGLLIHTPAGVGKTTLYLVDLGVGHEGNRIVGEVRNFRNAGKKAIDLKTNYLEQLAAGVAV